jgi:hypothetical protein
MISVHKDFLPYELLDIPQIGPFEIITEGNSDATTASPPGPSDAMDITFGLVGKVVVEDVADLLHINPTGGNIGGNEQHHGAILETRQGPIASPLRLVAVNCLRPNLGPHQLLAEAIGSVLGAGKDNGPGYILGAKDVRKQSHLVALGNEANLLVNPLDGGGFRGHLDLHRIVQEGPGQLHDGRRHGGRKEQVLTLLWQVLEDLPDVVNKAHVEHTIGLVENEELHCIEVDEPPSQQVQQSARGRHQDLLPTTQGLDLGILIHPPEDHQVPDVQVLSIG